MPDSQRTAVVTGSSGGIGKAIAMRLLRSGVGVVLNYSNNDGQAADTLSECRAIGPRVILVKADISRGGEPRNLIRRAIDEFGALELLYNNAAPGTEKPALDRTEAHWVD